MRDSIRFWLLAGALIATATASAQAGATVSNGTAPGIRNHSWIAAAARKKAASLIFVSDTSNNVVDIYSTNNPSGGMVGQIKGSLSLPASLAVDKTGNLFVYNGRTNSILEFAPPYTGTAINAFYDGLNGVFSLAVDSGGTIYAANNGLVVEFPHGHTSSKIVNLPVTPTGVTIDGHGNLICAFNGGGSAGVFRLTHASPIPVNLLIPLEQSTADILFDANDNLVVEDMDGAYINVYPPGAIKPSKKYTAGFSNPGHMAFSADRSVLYVSDFGNNTVRALDYPSGTQRWQIGGFTSAQGVAVTPAAIP